MRVPLTVRIETMGGRFSKGSGTGAAGFTLVELVLATLISAMVVGIFSVALSISLRAWERQQNRQPSDLPSLVQLFKWQMAAFEPIEIAHGGRKRILFEGDGHALAFATSYSVRAISRGLPVVARYVFVPGRGELYYAELPLDPYHPEPINRFLMLSPGASQTRPHFYVTEVAEFSFTFLGKERETMDLISEDASNLPIAVAVRCTAKGSSEAISTLVFRNSPFAKARQQIVGEKAGFPGSQIRRGGTGR